MNKETLINDICEVIADHTPFSAAAIRVAYDAYKSFDLIIKGCEWARISGFGLESAVKEIDRSNKIMGKK